MEKNMESPVEAGIIEWFILGFIMIVGVQGLRLGAQGFRFHGAGSRVKVPRFQVGCFNVQGWEDGYTSTAWVSFLLSRGSPDP